MSAAAENFGAAVAAWAAREPSVSGLVLIGSQARAASDTVWRADAQSDWDFQVITTRPQMFAGAAWTRALGVEVKAYAARTAQIGGVPKVAALFAGAEADFVVLPAARLRLARLAVALGLHRRPGALRRSLQDLAVVIRPGWRFLHGAAAWEKFYRRVVADVPDPRLGDAEARTLAAGAECDAVWVRRKLERGELAAAQRMLHRALAEVNFRLLHELRLRRGERTFPEARRLERVAAPGEIAAVAVDARLEAAALAAALEKSLATCRALAREFG